MEIRSPRERRWPELASHRLARRGLARRGVATAGPAVGGVGFWVEADRARGAEAEREAGAVLGRTGRPGGGWPGGGGWGVRVGLKIIESC